jgi:hypothetical protein
MEKGGLFLTEKGFHVARGLYDLAMKGDNLNLVPLVRDKIRHAMSDEDSTFDDFYAAIYGLKLSNHREHFNVGKDGAPNSYRVAELKAMLGLEFHDFDRKASFDQSLINEYMVADVMSFNFALRDLLPYEVAIQKVGTGCLWLEYSIYGFGTEKARPDLPQLSKRDVEWNKSGDVPASAQAWFALKERFHAEIELKLS